MSCRAVTLFFGLGLGLCAAEPCHAGSAGPAGGKAGARAGKGGKEERQARKAQDLVGKGDAARGKGQYALALQYYQQAYEAKPLPEIQQQIGECHRGMGNAGRAAFAYRQYLKYSSEPGNRREVEELAVRMEQLARETRGNLSPDAEPEAVAEEGKAGAAPAEAGGCPGCSREQK